ncbi:XRE family transcriptional regulator [Sphaerisporangium album]|uniref:XRE family transcriptional regulator n=1 Tax=Sphaerisporangium album TaxID=509200 RepID=A0A367FQH3_9ACTN|nr:helix-turn-helix domain-containing protein [Sphaerisporangium album]RCG32092.1 XRE family transcriptional regulator [Sphaerisporangium album]
MAADPIDPHASAWHLFGAVMRRCRESEPRVALRRAAADLYVDHSNLAKWERGERTPPPEMVSRLDEVYGAGGILTALYGTLVRLNAAAESDRLRAGRYLENPAYRNGDDDMERRAALQFLAGLTGLGALDTLGISGEPLRRFLELSPDQANRAIEEWELACADHLHALRTRPPAQVAADLLIDLLAVRRQLDTSTPADVIELQRVMAALSTLHANVLTRLGDHGAAIRWWRTARQASDASGDLELRLSVRATETGHGLFGQRDPATVLRLTQSAQQIAGDRPSLGLALILCSQAKALMLLGRHAEAQQTLNTFRELVTADPPAVDIMPGYWNGGQLPNAENTIYAGAGNEAEANSAGERLLTLNSDYQTAARVRLNEALCTVVNGGIDQGMQLAASVIDALPQVYNDRMVLETGRRVLSAVPKDQPDRPSVAEFREMLALEPARSA